MKVTVERAALLKSLGHVHRVVERRNTIPILANVLIKADQSRLAFKATDLDLEVTETLAAEVGPSGSTTVPAHMFYEIVRKLPEGAQIAPCWQSAPAAPALPCRPCRRATFLISPPAK
jgi:DNA polymerase-3 subunit beta